MYPEKRTIELLEEWNKRGLVVTLHGVARNGWDSTTDQGGWYITIETPNYFEMNGKPGDKGALRYASPPCPSIRDAVAAADEVLR